MTAPYKISSTPLAINTVVRLLQNPPQDSVCYVPPARPKAGEVYIYSDGGNDDKKGLCYWMIILPKRGIMCTNGLICNLLLYYAIPGLAILVLDDNSS